jgi:hypothetical protein
MPAYGSGLSSQLMIKQETTVGTQVTPTLAYEYDSEGIDFDPGWQEAQGLRAGQGYVSVGRVQQTAFDVAGDITLKHVDRGLTTGGGMGLWWKHALGSTVTAGTIIGATTAYKQIHVPGSKTGLALTAQVGRPQTDATVRPYTFRGMKISQWEFTCADQGLAQLKLTVNAWQEDVTTALATASYPPGAEVFAFQHATNFKIGGTPATSAGETTITSGVTVGTVATSVTITGNTPLADGRRGLGNGGIKKEQIENDIPTITGSLAGEFTTRAEFYDVFKSGATTALQLDFSKFSQSGTDAGGTAAGPNPFLLSFIFPACKIKAASVHVDGPDILGQDITFQAYSNNVDPVVQVKLVEVANSAL